MNTIIRINIGEHQFEAEIFDTETGRAIVEALPFEAAANIWGDEIYFDVPARAELETGAQAEVQVGDLAYWPSMPAFCIFFGPTPVSLGNEPRAASPVNVFGKLVKLDLELLSSCQDGQHIRVTL